MTEPMCAHCRFFEQDAEQEDVGLCKRYPPWPSRDEEMRPHAVRWPILYTDDWCGEFQDT